VSQADLYGALGITPLDFQLQAREAYRRGESGLIQVPTGSGKTLAAVAGPLEEIAAARDAASSEDYAGASAGTTAGAAAAATAGATANATAGTATLKLLYITPLRALSRDTEQAVRRAVEALGAGLTVACRTGDVPQSRRARQLERMPEVLITTPESLSVLLSRPGSAERFRELRCAVVDEWHELLSTKRGTQVELALARLRAIQPALQSWALSATVGNPAEAARAACGCSGQARIISSELRRPIALEVVEPSDRQALPWSGHLGTSMAPDLLRRLDPEVSTLIFTNTRRQAERWYQRLLELVPEQAHRVALHHGSIDGEIRRRIEEAARTGGVKWTVATASLDLGIDFAPVEQVVQIGSAKSIGRLIQRAGRSAHQPGRTARMLFVPTHALELVEVEAARRALEPPRIEPRHPLPKPLDVLAQHLVTLACGDGFVEKALFSELRGTESYADLSREEFYWVLDFVARGGKSLRAYDHYRKLEHDGTAWRVRDRRIARIHRMSIGTIDGNSQLRVIFTNHREVGTVEEGFVSKLSKGDTFYFAGRMLEFVMIKDTTVYVRSASGRAAQTPSWPGGALPLSPSLGSALREELAAHATGREENRPPAAGALAVLDAQRRASVIPEERVLLAEVLVRRERAHLFLYPFEGRPVHDGLAAVLATRMQRGVAGSFAISTNDYGLQIEAGADYPLAEVLTGTELFSGERLEADLRETANVEELARRAFRGIARVSGLVFPGYPGAQKSLRQIQASASVLFDVFREHEPDNLLLREARREVLRTQLNADRLAAVMERLQQAELRCIELEKPSPLSFPLLVEQLSQRSSSLSVEERIARLRRQYALA
jgi:ATP-dependent Lhr-like helicase